MRDRTIGGRQRIAAGTLAAALILLALSTEAFASMTAVRGARIAAVGAENEYADVIGQIGGKYVSVTAIMSNPNTDPHAFEASPSVARVVSAAQLVIQNGVGYDSFMDKIESASPNSKRQVINVQKLLGLPDSTANPHLWYSPETMPAVAKAVAADLSELAPAHAGYFAANAANFDSSLKAWDNAIAEVKSKFPNAPIATTEPVANDMLEAAGTDNLTPWTLQADIMNGIDPSPQDISLQESLFTRHKVKVFVYNQQVSDSVTASFLSLARKNRIPVVGVYETMPNPGYDYQSWMLAEVKALQAALGRKQSTTVLLG